MRFPWSKRKTRFERGLDSVKSIAKDSRKKLPNAFSDVISEAVARKFLEVGLAVGGACIVFAKSKGSSKADSSD